MDSRQINGDLSSAASRKQILPTGWISKETRFLPKASLKKQSLVDTLILTVWDLDQTYDLQK